MLSIRVLLVDDDEVLRYTLATILRRDGYAVDVAGSVAEALQLIGAEAYDVLLSDLHMPGAGDGLTAISAMRHANPKAVTLLLSAFPEMAAAANAIQLQADEILVKPMDPRELLATIKRRIRSGPVRRRVVESVAAIIARTSERTIQDWYERIQMDKKVMAVDLSYEDRCGHLPQLLRDLVDRLGSSEPIGSKALVSVSAVQHGVDRRRQGYSASMIVEESRMLQVSLFHTLQSNLASIDFSLLLLGVMTIADEVDSQLSQAMDSYVGQRGSYELVGAGPHID